MNNVTNLKGSKGKPKLVEKKNKLANLLLRYQKDSYTLACLPRPIALFKNSMCKGTVNAAFSWVKATDIINHYIIPYAKGPMSPHGYQRVGIKGRFDLVAERLVKEFIDVPLSLTLNIRNEAAFDSIKNGKFIYNPTVHSSLYVGDGQTRLEGIRQCLIDILSDIEDGINRDKSLNHLESLILPCTFAFTENIDLEMMLFDEINTYTRGLPKDQVLHNAAKRVRLGQTQVMNSPQMKDGGFTVVSLLEEAFNDSGSVWYRRIKFPGGEALTPNVGLNSFTKYLKTIVNWSEIEIVADDRKKDLCYKIFNAYWDGLKAVYPIFFDESGKDFAIQKAIGADSMMRMFELVVSWSKRNNPSMTDLTNPETYKPAFKKMIGGMRAPNAEGDFVQGHEFWRRSGAAGGYSSERGKTQIHAFLKAALID